VAIFGSFSAVGLLANALAIPVFTFLLVPPVLVATACLLLPWSAAAWFGGLLVALAGHVAALLWPVLSWCAGLPLALWRTEAPWTWYLLAPGLVLLIVLPLPWRMRLPALATLCSTFLLRDPAPRAGEAWIDMLDAGASTAVVLRTRHHLLLWGSAEVFGSDGVRFERLVLPVLRASGLGAIDLWLPGNLSRDVQAAQRLAAANLPLRAMLPPSARGVPPEQQPCGARSWTWDQVRFELELVNGDCGLVMHTTAGAMALGGSVARHAGAGDMRLLLLPRAAGAVQGLAPQPSAVLLASLSRNEWNSPAWQRQRARLQASGSTIMSTAASGRVRLKLGEQGLRRRLLHEAGG
jgi:beta-lactamase superfamily II metal-dependent hydrolase